MTDLLSIGAAGVRAIQGALTALGDNVANADTPGYVRRTVTLVAPATGGNAPLQRLNLTGSGVAVGSIDRSTDALKTNAARAASGDAARLATRADWLGRLQTAMAAGDVNLRLGGFFDAATDLASAPTSVAARTIFLDRADQAATGFRETGAGLAGLQQDITRAANAAAGEVNAITDALGRVNEELRRTATGSSSANGLLDNRDTLLADLATRVKISVIEGQRGTVEVRLGTGAAAAVLVPAKGNVTRIGARDGPGGYELVLDPTHAANVVRLPASGSIAGLLEAGRQAKAAIAEIDALAVQFGGLVNKQHLRGSDGLGDPGAALFATQTIITAVGRANAGSAPVDTEVADGAVLAADGYRLLRDSTGWTLARIDGSAAVSGPGVLTLDGVTVTPGAGARDGDLWLLKTVGGAAGLALRPIGAERLAVADRWLTDAGAANTGGSLLSVAEDASAAGLPALPAYAVAVIAAGVAEVRDPATGDLLATVAADGSMIAGGGFRFAIPATAGIGDTFRIVAAKAGSSDNGNARAIAALRAQDGPGGTLEGAFDAGIARIGSALSETDRLAESAKAVSADAAAAADAVSGVDLDREAAELTRLQAAYRANAKVMQAARDLFDTLLQAVQ